MSNNQHPLMRSDAWQQNRLAELAHSFVHLLQPFASFRRVLAQIVCEAGLLGLRVEVDQRTSFAHAEASFDEQRLNLNAIQMAPIDQTTRFDGPAQIAGEDKIEIVRQTLFQVVGQQFRLLASAFIQRNFDLTLNDSGTVAGRFATVERRRSMIEKCTWKKERLLTVERVKCGN